MTPFYVRGFHTGGAGQQRGTEVHQCTVGQHMAGSYPSSASLLWDKVIFVILITVSVCWTLSLGAMKQKILQKVRRAACTKKTPMAEERFIFFFSKEQISK